MTTAAADERMQLCDSEEGLARLGGINDLPLHPVIFVTNQFHVLFDIITILAYDLR